MNKIPVVIVDDSEVDRYIVKRRLAKADGFGEISEVEAGDVFLKTFSARYQQASNDEQPLLVLMDVNMPRMNGFETVEELQRQLGLGNGPNSIVVMMFTSSNNPNDLARAKALGIVKGYILKPLDDSGIDQIRQAYAA